MSHAGSVQLRSAYCEYGYLEKPAPCGHAEYHRIGGIHSGQLRALSDQPNREGDGYIDQALSNQSEYVESKRFDYVRVRMTSGFTARVLARHSRCCWPTESLVAGECSRSFTSSHKATSRSTCSAI